MRLNFWQWVGIICIVIAVIFILARRTNDHTPVPSTTAPPATTPLR